MTEFERELDYLARMQAAWAECQRANEDAEAAAYRAREKLARAQELLDAATKAVANRLPKPNHIVWWADDD